MNYIAFCTLIEQIKERCKVLVIIQEQLSEICGVGFRRKGIRGMFFQYQGKVVHIYREDVITQNMDMLDHLIK